MKYLAIAIVAAGWAAVSTDAHAQATSAAPSGTAVLQNESTWRSFMRPLVDFSRAPAKPQYSARTTVLVPAGYAQMAAGTGPELAPPPAPGAELPPSSARIFRPQPGVTVPPAPAPVAGPAPYFAPNAFPAIPPGSSAGGEGSEMASPAPDGLRVPFTDPDLSRLRTMPPPPSPMEIATPDGAMVPGAQAAPSSPPAPPPLVFRTRDVVRPDLLRGRKYRLAEYAPLVDYKFRFEIETPWGTIPAHGMAMLDLRLHELQALEYGSRIAAKNPQFVEGMVQAALDTPKGAYIFVTDPVDSVCRTVSGVKRIAQAKWSPGGKRANCESRRRIACLIGCDPETHNPPLQCLLDDMSKNACAGWLTADVSLYFGFTGLGGFAANAEFKRMAESRSTLEIQASLDAAFKELGIADETRAKFFASPNYTTTQRMAFVFYLRKLVGVENLTSLVEAGVDTVNESEALASIQELQLLTDLRRTQPITRVSFLGLPIVALGDGSQVIATVADYIVESQRFAQLIARYRTDFPTAPTTLVTVGRVSPGAEKLLAGIGISVVRHKFLDDEESAKSEKGAKTALAPETTLPSRSQKR